MMSDDTRTGIRNHHLLSSVFCLLSSVFCLLRLFLVAFRFSDGRRGSSFLLVRRAVRGSVHCRLGVGFCRSKYHVPLRNTP
jgi:hypothetical protein